MILKKWEKRKTENRYYRALREQEEAAARRERAEVLRRQKLKAAKRKTGDDQEKTHKRSGLFPSPPTKLEKRHRAHKKAERRKEGARKPRGVFSPKAWTGRFEQQVSEVSTSLSNVDPLILVITMILLGIGLVMVLSSSSYMALIRQDDAFYYFKRQFIFAIIGLLGLAAMVKIPHALVRRVALPIAIATFFLILYVSFFGIEVDGAKRWLEIGSIAFAPSDLAKPIGVVCFAAILSEFGDYIKSWRGYLIILVLMAIFPLVIVKEDLGTALAVSGGLFAMLVSAGAPKRYLGATLLTGVFALVAAIVAEPYRIRRITGFLSPFSEANVQGDGWQLVQSLYALGSGGLFGVGLGNSGQKMLYLPAMHTDFIFSVWAEEAGFIGGLFLLILFIVFMWRGLWIGLHLKDQYQSLTTIGLTMTIGIQAFINIGVCVGVMPVTGITLPFISYGGTSLAVTLAMVGYILNMSRYIER